MLLGDVEPGSPALRKGLVRDMAEVKRLWTRTSDDPEAYRMRKGNRWGLVRRHGKSWELYLILSAASMRRVEEYSSEAPPFEWASERVKLWDERISSGTWEERDIGTRKPGEEGNSGGRLIPMQTFDERGRKRARDAT